MGRHPAPNNSDPTGTLDHVLRWVADEDRSRRSPALHLTPREAPTLRALPASNNVAEYEALVNGLRIAIELGVRCLDTRGDSQLVIDQVMKNSHCRDPKMEA
jgi:ribonuclease HI